MRRATAMLLVVLAPAAFCRAGENPTDPDRLGELVFSDLYGDEFRAVADSDGSAKLELARSMLTRAELWGGNRTFVILHYRRAYELTSGYASHYDVAVKAMRRQAERFPDTRIECLQRVAEVQRRMAGRSGWSRDVSRQLMTTLLELAESAERDGNLARAAMLTREAGQVARRSGGDGADELQQRARELVILANVARRADALKQRLQRDPDDSEARTHLVLLEVTERDDPATARKLLTPELDADLRHHVRLAAADPAELSARQCRELSRWYEDLARTGSPVARRNAGDRAEKYEQLAAGGPLAAAIGADG
ncbi:MAG: hypothetical protein ACP5HU_04010 [Phycisphaerae bacterium]